MTTDRIDLPLLSEELQSSTTIFPLREPWNALPVGKLMSSLVGPDGSEVSNESEDTEHRPDGSEDTEHRPPTIWSTVQTLLSQFLSTTFEFRKPVLFGISWDCVTAVKYEVRLVRDDRNTIHLSLHRIWGSSIVFMNLYTHMLNHLGSHATLSRVNSFESFSSEAKFDVESVRPIYNMSISSSTDVAQEGVVALVYFVQKNQDHMDELCTRFDWPLLIKTQLTSNNFVRVCCGAYLMRWALQLIAEESQYYKPRLCNSKETYSELAQLATALVENKTKLGELQWKEPISQWKETLSIYTALN